MLNPGDIISHHEMCQVEGRMLQQGMNFLSGRSHSVILMSVRPNAPYPDRFSEDGTQIFYIGHDFYGEKNKDLLDQPLTNQNGTKTQNGKFFEAAANSKFKGIKHYVRVYEKLRPGIWVYNGLFSLDDARYESDGVRKVCVFVLTNCSEQIEETNNVQPMSPGRTIPTQTKLAVWKRDRGKCVKCGSSKNLHFDHIIPFSQGGSSTNPENIQLLCQKHNLEKSDSII